MPSIFFELSLSRSFFRTTPAKKPRTECCCQPVAFITAAIVVPVGEFSISTTRACFESFTSDSFRSVNVAVFGARWFLEHYANRLLTRFKLTELPASPDELIAAVGRRRGCLRSGGVIDLHKAAEILVHEFRVLFRGP